MERVKFAYSPTLPTVSSAAPSDLATLQQAAQRDLHAANARLQQARRSRDAAEAALKQCDAVAAELDACLRQSFRCVQHFLNLAAHVRAHHAHARHNIPQHVETRVVLRARGAPKRAAAVKLQPAGAARAEKRSRYRHEPSAAGNHNNSSNNTPPPAGMPAQRKWQPRNKRSAAVALGHGHSAASAAPRASSTAPQCLGTLHTYSEGTRLLWPSTATQAVIQRAMSQVVADEGDTVHSSMVLGVEAAIESVQHACRFMTARHSKHSKASSKAERARRFKQGRA